jgi:predicted oxidoreductase (fatty acid repression mutant protein)
MNRNDIEQEVTQYIFKHNYPLSNDDIDEIVNEIIIEEPLDIEEWLEDNIDNNFIFNN